VVLFDVRPTPQTLIGDKDPKGQVSAGAVVYEANTAHGVRLNRVSYDYSRIDLDDERGEMPNDDLVDFV
jgi:hypothetical protein